jgi:TM2 domain-containing membrane protein YozV
MSNLTSPGPTSGQSPETAPPTGGAPATSPPALPPGYAMAPAVRLPKSPFVAVLLSLIFPGLGQIYNGQINKAFAFFGSFVASIFATATIDPMPFALFIPFVLLYGYVDAWKSATAINNRFLGGKAEPEDEALDSPVWGGVLVVVGLLLLLHNLNVLDLARFQRYWPVLLILAGGYFIRRSLEARKSGAGGSEGGKEA